ncbi:phage tail tape measure protein [Micrococcales bacterium 31B]|nr:phage tail tape measure protein [Micrococcales bacterium 31B]
MADRVTRLTVRAEVRQMREALRQAGIDVRNLSQETQRAGRTSAQASAAQVGAWRRVGRAIANNTQHVDTFARGFAVVGVALLGVAAAAIKTSADFDKAMSSVKAATHASTGEMNQLRDAAIDMGAKSAFGASDAAGGIEELAKAGVSTADILRGGLKGAMDLAAAGGIGVAESAETAASALTQFKLRGADVPHIADLLAAGAGKAQGGVSDLSQALNQSGLVAAQTGLTIEETTGTLAAFASAGLVGSDAGTSFKTMLLALNPKSEKAATLMDELGIKAYDASGKFVGMSAFAGNLRESLSGLSAEQRQQTLSTIFGTDAIRAASIIYEQGAVGIDQWTTAVSDSGYAAETARIQMDNLAGDWEQLKGALETALITTGDGGQGFLRDQIQAVTFLIDEFNKLSPAAKNAIGTGAGVAGLSLLAAGGILKIVTGLAEARAAANALGLSFRMASLAAGAIGLAIGAATFIFSRIIEDAAKAKARTDEVAESVDGLSGKLQEGARSTFIQTLKEDINAGDWKALDDMGVSIKDATDALMAGPAATEAYALSLEEMWRQGKANGTITEQQDKALVGLIQSLGRQRRENAEAIESAKLTAQANGEAEESIINWDEAAASFAETADDVNGTLEEQEERIRDALDAYEDAIGAFQSMDQAQQSLADQVRDGEKALAEIIPGWDRYTEAGSKNRDLLSDHAKAMENVRTGMIKQGATAEEINAQMATSEGMYFRLAEAMGLSREEAEEFGRQYGALATLDPATLQVQVKDADVTAQNLDRIRQMFTGLKSDWTDGDVLAHFDLDISKAELNHEKALTDLDYLAKYIVTIKPDMDPKLAMEKAELVQAKLVALDLMKPTPIVSANPQALYEFVELATRRLDQLDKTSTDPAIRAEIAELERGVANAKSHLNSMPAEKRVNTYVNGVDGVRVSMEDVRRYLNGVGNKTVTITTYRQEIIRRVREGGTQLANANGGFISGPGTGTSDSILSWLSDGEYVIRASAVARPGMRSLLDRINAGAQLPADAAQRFASGGLVGGVVAGGGLPFRAAAVQQGVTIIQNNTINYPKGEPTSRVIDRKAAEARTRAGLL